MTPGKISDDRRQFLRFLAATPVLPFLRLSPMLQQALADDQKTGDPDGSAPSVLKSLQLYGEQIVVGERSSRRFDLGKQSRAASCTSAILLILPPARTMRRLTRTGRALRGTPFEGGAWRASAMWWIRP